MVNGVAGLENRPQMAFIPTGTTNDYARALKIPMVILWRLLALSKKNQTIQMDIGRAYGGKYFINIAAAGTMTELTFSVPSSVKSRLGYFAYVAEAAKMLPRNKARKVRIEAWQWCLWRASVYDFRGLDQPRLLVLKVSRQMLSLMMGTLPWLS